MQRKKPIVAIVGSPRYNSATPISQLDRAQIEQEAQTAARQLGEELAKADWRIAVYSSNTSGIDPFVVSGFVASGVATERSIVWYHRQTEKKEKFQEREKHKDLFDPVVDTGDNWEGPFYRSIAHVQGILLLGGGDATLIAGQMALTRNLPIVALAHFEGSAKTIWRQLSSKPAFVEDDDIQVMATWDENDSPKKCIQSLANQFDRSEKQKKAEQEELEAMQVKANRWDEHLSAEKEGKSQKSWAVVSFAIFLMCLLIVLRSSSPSLLYSAATILGLCFAGGSGAACRMLIPGAPISRKWNAPILGTIAGLVFTLLYLGPLQGSSFLFPSEASISSTTKSQYVTSLVVAFLAGLGFDFAFQQLLRRSSENTEKVTKAVTTRTSKLNG